MTQPTIEKNLREKFWEEYAEGFNESQEWLFNDIADWWLEKLSSSHTALLTEIMEDVKKLGHQQDDDTIWCEMDKVLSLLSSKIKEQ